MNLKETLAHFHELYGGRTLFVNSSFQDTAAHFHLRLGRLNDALRKDKPLDKKLARLFSYFARMVNHFDGFIDLNEALCMKFPSYGCSYCESKPCACGEKERPPSVEAEADPNQLDWSISQWQWHLRDVYGDRNRKQGIAYVTNRLQTEVAELTSLILLGPGSPRYPNEILKECERELADIFTWIVAAAYVLDVNLEASVELQFPVCPVCKKKPCNCPLVFVSVDGIRISTVGSKGFSDMHQVDEEES